MITNQYKFGVAILIIALIADQTEATPQVPFQPAEDPNFKVPPKDDKCRGLALRGGGTKGAYEVGALKAFIEIMDPIDYAYDVLSGVSIGAFNAAYISTYNRGYEKIAVVWLEEMWSIFGAKDFWQNWTLWIFEALWRSSFLNSQGFTNGLKQMFKDRTVKRKLALQTVDLNTGEVIVYDETLPADDLHTIVQASSTMPTIFAAVPYEGRVLVDGGTFSNLNLQEVVRKCKDEGYEEKDIIVDLILCFDVIVKWDEWTMQKAKYSNAYDLYKRKEIYRFFYYYFEDITRVIRGYPNVHFRHMITPSVALGGGYIPIFDGPEINVAMIQQGYEEAKENLEHYYKMNPKNGTNSSTEKPNVKSDHQQKPPVLNFEFIRNMIEMEQ